MAATQTKQRNRLSLEKDCFVSAEARSIEKLINKKTGSSISLIAYVFYGLRLLRPINIILLNDQLTL
jgi:hypothetical protein